ncbi:MAG: LOG family protein, partial [Gemmatimonadetes bacterium]|nr:LOG family protein [Gemmatimonadota bacterium]
DPNPYLDRWVNIHYFFLRKVFLFKYSYGFVGLPGGAGTMDELFEAVTLIQTKKIAGFPIVLMGKEYWKPLIFFLKRMVEEGAILECIYSDITVCASRIKAVGAEHWVLATDLGQPGRAGHDDGFKTPIIRMRDEGITQEQIDMMVRKNPARLLGLEPW